MLKKQNSPKLERKKSELKVAEGEIAAAVGEAVVKTAGERVRDASVKAALDAAYTAGNNTDKIVEVADKVGKGVDKVGNVINGGTTLVGGAESSGALGNICYKTLKDISRGDKVCTGLCLVSASCESIALGCSVIKVMPFRGRLYVAAKIVSRGCMAYRNACAGEGC